MNDVERFRNKLNENTVWPLSYMFKFIVPNIDGRVDQVKALMPSNGKISFKHTASLKFVSVTCIAIMDNAEQIIEVTQKAIAVEGVMAL